MIQVFTFPEWQNYMNRLPAKFDKAIPQIQEEAAKTFQRMLKFRINSVSPYSTNNLKNSIVVKPARKKGDFDIMGAYYFKYVNAGIGPAFIPVEFLEQHMANPNAPGEFVPFPKAWISPESHYNEGVLQKTTDAFVPKYIQIIERGIMKALQK